MIQSIHKEFLAIMIGWYIMPFAVMPLLFQARGPQVEGVPGLSKTIWPPLSKTSLSMGSSLAVWTYCNPCTVKSSNDHWTLYNFYFSRFNRPWTNDTCWGILSTPEAEHNGELRRALYGDTVATADCIRHCIKMVTWLWFRFQNNPHILWCPTSDFYHGSICVMYCMICDF